ncbi:MAG: glucose-6-phosphate isomerase [Antricoccus sp.]
MTIRYRSSDAVNIVIDELVTDEVASRLNAGDPTLWGADVESDASVKLSWLSLPETSRPLLAEIADLKAQLREQGLDQIVLVDTGSGALAAAAYCAASDVELLILDSAEPQHVARALGNDLAQTVLVVSSKSGAEQSSDAIRRIYEQAFTAAQVDYRDRIVVVTDPDSPLHTLAIERQYRRVFLADPHVGGHYAALSAFGLVPAGLAGADIAGVLDDAAAISPALATNDASNPAIALAAVLSAALHTRTDKLVFADGGAASFGLERWMKCFVAESAINCATWLVPVLVESDEAIGYLRAGQDAIKIAFGSDQIPAGGSRFAIAADGPIGLQIMLWQYAIAILGRLQDCNPFAQPNTAQVADRVHKILDGSGNPNPPCATDAGIEIFAPGSWLRDVTDVRGALDALAACVHPHGYVGVGAFLDHVSDVAAVSLRSAIAAKTAVQTTFEWGAGTAYASERAPADGGGVFLQITASTDHDLPVCGCSYSLADLYLAQASDHAAVLADKALPVLRLHLTDRATGLATIVKALDAPA